MVSINHEFLNQFFRLFFQTCKIQRWLYILKVYRNVRSLAKKVSEIKKRNKTIGLVPTMGFLHEGHSSLIRRARKDTECVIVTIFVNPTQFGPKEDFKKYPRDLKRDLDICKKEGADIIFVPEAKDMYPKTYATYVNV